MNEAEPYPGAWTQTPRQLPDWYLASLRQLAQVDRSLWATPLRAAMDHIAWLEAALTTAREQRDARAEERDEARGAYDSLTSGGDAPNPPWSAEARYQAELPEDFR